MTDTAISKKNALERIFVYQAVELGYLTQDQMALCIEDLEKHKIPIPLLTVCKQKGFLKPSQVNHLMSKRMDASIAKALGEGLSIKKPDVSSLDEAPAQTFFKAPIVPVTTSEKDEYEKLIAAKDRLLEQAEKRIDFLQRKLSDREETLNNYEQKKKQSFQEVVSRKQNEIENLESELACYRGLYEKSEQRISSVEEEYNKQKSKVDENADVLNREKLRSRGLQNLVDRTGEELQVAEEKLLAIETELEKERNSSEYIKSKLEKEAEERKKIKEEYQRCEDDLIKLQNTLGQSDNELNSAKKAYEDVQKHANELDAALKGLKEEKNSLLQKISDLKSQSGTSNKEDYKEFFDVTDELQKNHAEENTRLKEELDHKKKLEEEYEALQKKYQEDLHNLNAQLDSIKQSKEEQINYSEELRKEMRILQDVLENEKAQKEEMLHEQKANYESEVSQYKQKNETLQSKLDQYQQTLHNWDEKDKEIDVVKKKLEEAAKEKKQAVESKVRVEVELKSLQDQLSRFRQIYVEGEFETGTTLPGSNGEYYVVQKLLGRGGMGMVYSALQKDNKMVVVKTLLPEGMSDLKVLMRFVQEARTTIAFDHENLISGQDFQQSKDLTYFVMEYLDGESLEDMLDEQGLLDTVESTEIILGIAKALQYLEENCLVHRDVKPSNIIIAGNVPKLVDFGIVKMTDRTCSLTTEGIILGTPYYLSPEQTRETNVDIRSDIYSLGATYYHMVVGEVPFPGDNPIDVIQKRLDGSPRPGKVKPDLPKHVCNVIEKMMNKHVKKRHTTASDLVSDLQNVLKKIKR